MMLAVLCGHCSSVPVEVTSILLHHTIATYVTFGITIFIDPQGHSEVRPQVLPMNAYLLVFILFFTWFSSCVFYISFSSMVTPRYLTFIGVSFTPWYWNLTKFSSFLWRIQPLFSEGSTDSLLNLWKILLSWDLFASIRLQCSVFFPPPSSQDHPHIPVLDILNICCWGKLSTTIHHSRGDSTSPRAAFNSFRFSITTWLVKWMFLHLGIFQSTFSLLYVHIASLQGFLNYCKYNWFKC